MKYFGLNWVSLSHPSGRGLSLWAACAGIAALGAGSVRAQAAIDPFDADGDGLVIAQERVLGTSPFAGDTDGDGVSDLEELARHSSPVAATSLPDWGRGFSIGMSAHAQVGGIHMLTCVFMSDTDLRSKSLDFGFLGGGRLTLLSSDFVATHSTVRYFPSVSVHGCVAVIDTVIPGDLVLRCGELDVFVKGCSLDSEVSMDVLHLLSIAGVVVYAMPMPQPLVSSVVSYGGALAGRGTIYVPLLPAPETLPGGGAGGTGTGGSGGSEGTGGGGGPVATLPATWAAGEVCFQRSSFVGVSGATVTNEIVAAECLSGWDGFCPPSCTSTVGSTYKTVDPLVLIGG